ncbi:hypothetical protein E5Q_01206 [Mixia osmundae IAM 14324]|uniref:Vacuolar fusion protein MON1 n=1 Tax=Mixia osmundae (strain CBS 9802 / IAM 14324 / JCM 22182 / KY 12970) TaxID=764103 RepID=G7DVE4_MIXOS|nr:hypothetical protein E5Q_01206 [Mixia osmundae IAM 14324]
MAHSFGAKTTAEEVARKFKDRIAGRYILVTGASKGGLGFECARVLAQFAPALVILAGRSLDKMQDAISAIREETPNAKLQALELDLASLSQVNQAGQSIVDNHDIPRIDTLFNNAAVMAVRTYKTTADGTELQFGTNHVGHFAFTLKILPKILASASPRIINVSSTGHLAGNVRFEDYNFSNGKEYERWAGYAQAKTANILFTVGLAKRYKQLSSFALHPGGIHTPLQREFDEADIAGFRAKYNAYNEDGSPNLDSGVWKTLSEGTATHIVAAFDPEIESASPAYLVDCRLANGQAKEYALDDANADRLWELSQKLIRDKTVDGLMGQRDAPEESAKQSVSVTPSKTRARPRLLSSASTASGKGLVARSEVTASIAASEYAGAQTPSPSKKAHIGLGLPPASPVGSSHTSANRTLSRSSSANDIIPKRTIRRQTSRILFDSGTSAGSTVALTEATASFDIRRPGSRLADHESDKGSSQPSIRSVIEDSQPVPVEPPLDNLTPHEDSGPSTEAPDPRVQLRATLDRMRSTDRVETVQASHPPNSAIEAPLARLKLTASGASEARKRSYFVLTSAGKPVFSSEEQDEDATTSYMGVMQAIISIFADEGDRLKVIKAGSVQIAFLMRTPLYYVCCSGFGEPLSVLRMHLDYLHLQVLSALSLTQLRRVFEQRHNFDLRRMLEGTEGFLKSMVISAQSSLALLTGSLEVFRINGATREAVGQALMPTEKRKDLLYAIVLAGGRVVTLIRPKGQHVHPADLHVLLNTINSSTSLTIPGSESWLPICLPRYNSSGFLHAYISFISVSIGIVFIGGNREAFFDCQEWKSNVAEKLQMAPTFKTLEASVVSQAYSLGDLSIAGLRHFIYKSKTYVQVTSPAWEGPYSEQDDRERLIRLYQETYDRMHLRKPATDHGKQPARLIYLLTEEEAVLGWSTSTFEMYVAISPLLPKTAVVAVAHSVSKWIDKHVDSLFLTAAPSF